MFVILVPEDDHSGSSEQMRGNSVFQVTVVKFIKAK